MDPKITTHPDTGPLHFGIRRDRTVKDLTPIEVAELRSYLYTLEADLEVEIDLHGDHTRLVGDLRTLIISTQIELDKQI